MTPTIRAVYDGDVDARQTLEYRDLRLTKRYADPNRYNVARDPPDNRIEVLDTSEYDSTDELRRHLDALADPDVPSVPIVGYDPDQAMREDTAHSGTTANPARSPVATDGGATAMSVTQYSLADVGDRLSTEFAATVAGVALLVATGASYTAGRPAFAAVQLLGSAVIYAAGGDDGVR